MKSTFSWSIMIIVPASRQATTTCVEYIGKMKVKDCFIHLFIHSFIQWTNEGGLLFVWIKDWDPKLTTLNTICERSINWENRRKWISSFSSILLKLNIGSTAWDLANENMNKTIQEKDRDTPAYYMTGGTRTLFTRQFIAEAASLDALTCIRLCS